MTVSKNTQVPDLVSALYKYFSTDQSSYAVQQSGGRGYKRVYGVVTPKLLINNLINKGSIAIYQKNSDNTVNWICYDFDILKHNLDSDIRSLAEKEMSKTVSAFCKALTNLGIPYLLEFSGSRGIHVWVTFSESVNYGVAYLVLEEILVKCRLEFNSELIGIDKFPSTLTPSVSVGKAVKIPLSKHKKSGFYSLLLRDHNEESAQILEINDRICTEQLSILSAHRSISILEIEQLLGESFSAINNEPYDYHRVKVVRSSSSKITIEKLVEHWSNHPPLAEIAKGISGKSQLGNDQRELLVGILGKLQCKGNQKAGRELIHDVLQGQENYNLALTDRMIDRRSSYNFPSQEQIEVATLKKFKVSHTADSLINACIPFFESYDEAIFDIELADIEVTQASELNYLFLNDEVQVQTVIEDLKNKPSTELLALVAESIDSKNTANFYTHTRIEKKERERLLITSSAVNRISTSCIFKQILYFINFQTSVNSYGYKANRGFYGGYIFEPWLYLWIKFTSNISSAIKEESNENYYIVKTDIKSFYNDIPHDNLKRFFLGGINKQIDSKILNEKLDKKTLDTYKKYIDFLFKVTEEMVGGNKGLPQGPAYARYLAEIYLSNIDDDFDNKLRKGSIYFYQRYVDDIFFITPTEDAANESLEELQKSLQLSGLSINLNKTQVSKISNFSDDFNAYRSQSKYAVDKTSKDFINATETQKNLAINEFMSLVQSDTCEDDLAFVFSHLNGVELADSMKRDLMLTTINSGRGRGSLYRNLFSFYFRDVAHWGILNEVKEFTELQSEVLSSVMLTELQETEHDKEELLQLIEEMLPKMILTIVVQEHLALLIIKYGVGSVEKISADIIVSCLKTQSKGELLSLNDELVSHINTELNDIEGLDDFCSVMYVICSSQLSDASINKLAATFYSKTSSDYNNGKFLNYENSEIKDSNTTLKFYYLLCLYSTSEANKSVDALKLMWKFCASLFNLYGFPEKTNGQPNWFSKISKIKSDSSKTQLLLSAVFEGNFFSGGIDDYKVFEKYHENLLVYMAFNENLVDINNVKDALSKLRDYGDFYKWLIQPDEVNFFPKPTARKWFEYNVMHNSTIILKRKNEILFRKPIEKFISADSVNNEHNGYGEIRIKYNTNELYSFKEAINGITLKKLIVGIIKIVNTSNSTDTYPNIFVNDRLLKKGSWELFSEELRVSGSLIFESSEGTINPINCSKKDFIICCLNYAGLYSGSPQFKELTDKYINNLPVDCDVMEFLSHLEVQLLDEKESVFFYIDLAAASALYQQLGSFDPLERLDRFVKTYDKFNRKIEEKNIYGVSKTQKPTDLTLSQLTNTINYSLRSILKNTLPSLNFLAFEDVNFFNKSFKKILDSSFENEVKVDDFVLTSIKINTLSSTMTIDSKTYSFESIRLITPINNDIVNYQHNYYTLVSSSEHIYWKEIDSVAYLLPTPPVFSKIYSIIVSRHSGLDGRDKSFPDVLVEKEKITELSKFHEAVEIVSEHQDKNYNDSESLLINWLKVLPSSCHSVLVALIAGHVVMDKGARERFTQFVTERKSDLGVNLFLLKHSADFGGTHRVLYQDKVLGRLLEKMGPLSLLSRDNKIITLVVDNLMTGSQTKNALHYYCGMSGSENSTGYYLTTPEDSVKFVEMLRNLKEFHIHSIFYTQKSLDNIQKFLRETVKSNALVKAIGGQDISEDAFFSTTNKINPSDKERIKKMFSDQKITNLINSPLCDSKVKHSDCFVPAKSIDDYNLVSRFGSMPKHGFLFLTRGLRIDPDCHPFYRVPEPYELNHSD